MQEKNSILSQKKPHSTHSPRLRWILALLTLPLFGVITAFGIAPNTSTNTVSVTEVAQEIALPDIQLNADSTTQSDESNITWHLDVTQRGDTLAAVLDRLNIRNNEAVNYLWHAPEARAFSTRLGPGHSLLSKTTEQGELIELQFQIDAGNVLIVRKTGINAEAAKYTAQNLPVALDTRILVKSAEIESSLFAATDAAGIPDQVATKIADIFSSEIDFNLDLRKGDHFTVIYEAGFNNGELIKTGRVLAAEFVNKGKVLRGIAFGPEGHESYYSPEGNSLQKAFLRSPLEFSRISSGFTLARFHPILQTWRAHKGVDYAAPIGTRVKAVADATVDFVGGQGGYGNVVTLKHSNGVSTVYGHLSRFAPGLKRGQQIHQGDVIGFVGMTGLATGPHLHYEFRVHGEHRDPLTVALPTAVPLEQHQRNAFFADSQQYITQLDLLRGTDLAALE